jgi:choline dehydrogenase-like flavoprotein
VSDDRRRVTEVLAKSLTDKHFTVKAKTTVLSAGGIENARILLLCNEQISRGIGNQNDLVGRYFADHVWYNSGYILPFDQHPSAAALYQDEHHFDGNYGVRCHLALPANLNQELQIPKYRVELQVKRTYSFHKSIFSALRIREKLLSLNVDEISADDILNILQNPHEPIRFLWDKHDGPLVYGFGNYVETVPNPESRVMLSSERDALGLSRPELRWALTNQDKEGIIKGQKSFAREVGRSGVGRMRIFIPEVEDGILEGATGGNHHMGTTRMHNNAKFGVVDADSRVHGLQNLYVAGSSVFPSYGYANPTLTIVALSVRLADHLRMTCGCD